MAYSEEEGIQAIIDLQAAVGIEEPEESAKAGWRAMSARDRVSTECAHRMVCKKERPGEENE